MPRPTINIRLVIRFLRSVGRVLVSLSAGGIAVVLTLEWTEFEHIAGIRIPFGSSLFLCVIFLFIGAIFAFVREDWLCSYLTGLYSAYGFEVVDVELQTVGGDRWPWLLWILWIAIILVGLGLAWYIHDRWGITGAAVYILALTVSLIAYNRFLARSGNSKEPDQD